MRTQALRVTVGAYQTGGWHVTLIKDTYERGVLKNSELVWGPLYCGEDRLRGLVLEAVDHLIETERARATPERAAG